MSTTERSPATRGEAWLHVNTYAGHARYRVEVVGMTPKKYRIRALERTRLGGRCRWLYTGETALVPKEAVSLV